MKAIINREDPKPVMPPPVEEVVLILTPEEAAVLWRLGNSGGRVSETVQGLIGSRYGNDQQKMRECLHKLYYNLRPLMEELKFVL